MKQIYAPLQFGSERPTEKYRRESIYDPEAQRQYNFLKKKGLPITIPHATTASYNYQKPVELPFTDYKQVFKSVLEATASDDSGDWKDSNEKTRYQLEKQIYYNEIFDAKLRRIQRALNGEYLQWKGYYSSDGPKIRWTGEVTYYGSYLLLTLGMKMTPEFFYNIFFYSGLYKSKSGRFIILQFFEQILNIRFVKPYYDLLEKVGELEPDKLDGNPSFEALKINLEPGFTTVLPVINGTMAIARSFFSEREVSYNTYAKKLAPRFLASSTVNFVSATIVMNLFGNIFPVLVCQLASGVLVQLLSGKVIELANTYVFAQEEINDKELLEAEARKQIEKEKQEELEVRRKYIEIGIAGKQLDDRIKMEIDVEGYFGKNIATFQKDLYQSWKERGKDVPLVGSSAFDALFKIWGVSTAVGYILFRSSDDFSEYQLSSGQYIGIRFTFDFLTKLLKSFRFLGGIFSIEMLALPVVQKLRSDFIRIFTNLVAGLVSDVRDFGEKVTKKVFYTGGTYSYISRLEKQSIFADYFFRAMSAILSTISTATDPVLRSVLQNYLNLTIPLGYRLTDALFRFSIEDSLRLFQSMNLYFIKFGVKSLETAEGHVSFFSHILSQTTKGNVANPAPVFFQQIEKVPDVMSPDRFLGKVFGLLSWTVPKAFKGYDPKVFFLRLPTAANEMNVALDIPIANLSPEEKQRLYLKWQEIQAFQKLPAIFTSFLEGFPEEQMANDDAIDALFDKKMAEPETQDVILKLQITADGLTHFNKKLFREFVRSYKGFLEKAVEELNMEIMPEKELPPRNAFTVNDVIQGNLSRDEMSLFTDLFSQQYTKFVMSLVYKNASLFTSYKKNYQQNFSFKEQDGKLASHDLLLFKEGELPKGYTAYEFDDFVREVLTPNFFKVKYVIKKRGKMVEGKFVENKSSKTIYDIESEFDLPEKDKNQMIASFRGAYEMGYKLYYKKGNGTNVAGTETATPAAPITIRRSFEEFYSNIIRESALLPASWTAGFVDPLKYANVAEEYFFGDMNVVQIGERTTYFYDWKVQKGLATYIFNKRTEISNSERALTKMFRAGRLTPEDEKKYITLTTSRLINQSAQNTNDENRMRQLYSLMYRYQNLQLRTVEKLDLLSIFTGMVGETGDPLLLKSGEYTQGTNGALVSVPVDPKLTTAGLINRLIESIGAYGMFPDHRIAMFGGRENEIRSPGYFQESLQGPDTSKLRVYTAHEYWAAKPEKRVWVNDTLEYRFQEMREMLANEIHGFYGDKDGVAFYKSDLQTTTDSDESMAPFSGEGIFSISKNKINQRLFKNKVLTSSDKFKKYYSQIDSDTDDRFIFLTFLYLVTEDNKINVQLFQTALKALRDIRDQKDLKGNNEAIRREQIAYLRRQINDLEKEGKKKSGYLKQFFFSNFSLQNQNPLETGMETSSHYLYQMNYLLNVLKLRKRIQDNKTEPEEYKRKGLLNSELFDGNYPFLKGMDTQYSHISSFLFGLDAYMGMSLSRLDDFLGKKNTTREYIEFLKIKQRIRQAKIDSILRAIPLQEGDPPLSEDSINGILKLLQAGPEKWNYIDILKATGIGGYIPRPILRWLGSKPNTAEAFMSLLESPATLEIMLGDNFLESIETLVKERFKSIQDEQQEELRQIEEETVKIEKKHRETETSLKLQETDIKNKLDLLFTSVANGLSTRDIGPPLTAQQAAAAAEPPKGTNMPPQATTAGPAVQPPRPQIREATSQEIAVQLRQAQKLQQINQIIQAISQTTALSQQESLRLRNLIKLLLGGDESEGLTYSGGELDPDAYAVSLGAYPPELGQDVPQLKEGFDFQTPDFERCATYAMEYELEGAYRIKTNEVDPGLRDRYLGCLKQSAFIYGTKGLFSVEIAVGRKLLAATVSATTTATFVAGGTVGGIAIFAFLGAISGAGPFGAFEGAKAGAVAGAKAGLAASKIAAPTLGILSQIFQDAVINGYTNRYITQESDLAKQLADESKSFSADERINIYETFFNSKLETNEEYFKIKRELTYLITLLFLEQEMTENNSKKITEPLSKYLFGDGKDTHFNYYPYFKPSFEMITAIKDLKQFDISKIKSVTDLLVTIRDTKIPGNQGVLSFLFGEKYQGSVEKGQLEAQPSYDIWYKIGYMIHRLDKYKEEKLKTEVPNIKNPDIDALKTEQGGNLYQIFSKAENLLKYILSPDNPIAVELREATEEGIREGEEFLARRKEAAILEGRDKEGDRYFAMDDIVPHIYTLTQNIKLSKEQEGSDSFKISPLMVSENAMLGNIDTEETPNPSTSPVGNMIVRLFSGTQNNELWKSIPVKEKENFRNMFKEDMGRVYLTRWGAANRKGFFEIAGNIFSRDKIILNPYENLYNLLGYPYNSKQRMDSYLGPTVEVYTHDGGTPQTKVTLEKIDYTKANFPPFFIASEEKFGEFKEASFLETLTKYYDKQTVQKVYPGTSDCVTFFVFVLKEDNKRFKSLQEGTTSETPDPGKGPCPPTTVTSIDEKSYVPVSLAEVLVLNKKFRVKGIKNKKFNFTEEPTDSEADKWFKRVLSRLVFSTLADSYAPFISFEEGIDRVIGGKIENGEIVFETEKITQVRIRREIPGVKNLGLQTTADVKEPPKSLRNVRLVGEQTTKRLEGEQEVERQRKYLARKDAIQQSLQGKGLSPKTIDFLAIVLATILEDSTVFSNLEAVSTPDDKDYIETIIKSLFMIKLKDDYNARPDKPDNILSLDSMRLEGMSKASLDTIRTALGEEKVNAIIEQIEKNFIKVGQELKETYSALPPESPLREASKLLLKGSAGLKGGSIDEIDDDEIVNTDFTSYRIHYLAKIVYYPANTVVKYVM